MMDMASLASIPAGVLGLQGTVNAAIGIYGLVRPAEWNAQIADSFGGTVPTPAAYTISLQLVYMGILTVLAATQPRVHRRALMARIAVHLTTGYLFWDMGPKMRSAAMLDIGFAVMNALAFLFVGMR